MTELALPAAVLVLSVLATYWVCLRPMRHGQCGLARGRTQRVDGSAATNADVHQLRDEIRALRGQVGPGRPTPTESNGAAQPST